MNEKREQLLREFDAIAGRPATPAVYWKWIERAAAVLSSDASAHLQSSDAVDPHVGPRERVLRAPETPKTSLPGLQALIEQLYEEFAGLSLHWKRCRGCGRCTEAPLGTPIGRKNHRENCPVDKLSALLVVQGGVQQEEKEQDLARVGGERDVPSTGSTAQSATSDAPTPATKRWTDVLCQRCGGNGVIKSYHGKWRCPRCHGHCYEPDFEPTRIVPESRDAPTLATKHYACGVSATGKALPDYCPEHGTSCRADR